MSQYQTGLVSVTNGSPKVSGESTEFLTYVSVGDSFKVSGINAHYVVGSVDSDEELTLAANWAGVSASGETYQIVRDFTSNYDIPEIWVGDKDWPYHLTTALRAIDTEMKTIADSLSLSPSVKTVVNQGEVTTLNLAVGDLNRVHVLNNSGEATVNLPSVGSDYIGYHVEIRKKGNGIINIVAANSDTLVASGQTQVTAPSGEATLDFIKLFLETEDHWGCDGLYGPWETS